MKYQKKLKTQHLCPFDYGLEVIGDKWRARILCVLSLAEEGRPMRNKEIKAELPGISDAVLAEKLKELAAIGLIERRAWEETPPRVEYALTDRGDSVREMLRTICAWSRERIPCAARSFWLCRRCEHFDNSGAKPLAKGEDDGCGEPPPSGSA